ncbi:MAG: hypothetical protein QM532_03090 [Cyanobium sp. MAG06]|nr:hypothetical protein [Cyanobium sp. MAG06]
MIQYIQNDSIKKELYVKLKDVIEKGLNNENVNVRKSSARMIQYIQNITIKKELYEKLKDVIEKGLDDED